MRAGKTAQRISARAWVRSAAPMGKLHAEAHIYNSSAGYEEGAKRREPQELTANQDSQNGEFQIRD